MDNKLNELLLRRPTSTLQNLKVEPIENNHNHKTQYQGTFDVNVQKKIPNFNSMSKSARYTYHNEYNINKGHKSQQKFNKLKNHNDLAYGEAYERISNFFDKKQIQDTILNANTTQKRKKVIDFILKRRNEIENLAANVAFQNAKPLLTNFANKFKFRQLKNKGNNPTLVQNSPRENTKDKSFIFKTPDAINQGNINHYFLRNSVERCYRSIPDLINTQSSEDRFHDELGLAFPRNNCFHIDSIVESTIIDSNNKHDVDDSPKHLGYNENSNKQTEHGNDNVEIESAISSKKYEKNPRNVNLNDVSFSKCMTMREHIKEEKLPLFKNDTGKTFKSNNSPHYISYTDRDLMNKSPSNCTNFQEKIPQKTKKNLTSDTLRYIWAFGRVQSSHKEFLDEILMKNKQQIPSFLKVSKKNHNVWKDQIIADKMNNFAEKKLVKDLLKYSLNQSDNDHCESIINPRETSNQKLKEIEKKAQTKYKKFQLKTEGIHDFIGSKIKKSSTVFIKPIPATEFINYSSKNLHNGNGNNNIKSSIKSKSEERDILLKSVKLITPRNLKNDIMRSSTFKGYNLIKNVDDSPKFHINNTNTNTNNNHDNHYYYNNTNKDNEKNHDTNTNNNNNNHENDNNNSLTSSTIEIQTPNNIYTEIKKKKNGFKLHKMNEYIKIKIQKKL